LRCRIQARPAARRHCIAIRRDRVFTSKTSATSRRSRYDETDTRGNGEARAGDARGLGRRVGMRVTTA